MLKKFLKWWDEGSLFGYRAGYTLTHPITFIEGAIEEIRWANQRIFRGYDDRVVWGLDGYLARMIPIWVKALKKDKIGVPLSVFGKDDFTENGVKQDKETEEKAIARWNFILDKIAEGFEAYLRMNELSYQDPEIIFLQQKYELGFTLFKVYFCDLWD